MLDATMIGTVRRVQDVPAPLRAAFGAIAA
jgi:hypothetical protein